MQAPSFEAFNSDVNLDGFDFNLDGDRYDFMLADSKTSNASSVMDVQFDSMKEDQLTSSLNSLILHDAADSSDSEDETEPARRPQTNARASSRNNRSILSKSKTFQMNSIVNFDPPAAKKSNLSKDGGVSHALPSSASLSSLEQSSVFTLDNYDEALKTLAQTMKRTEESRRQVMLSRAMIKQKEELREAEVQALKKAQAVAFSSVMASSQFSTAFGGNSMSNGGSSLSGAAAFLSGSSGTLTSGLAQSRRQLQMYVAQVNSQTF